MKIYSPGDISALLKIQESTLRKYCLLLEEHGYEFSKNARGQRYYYDKDVITLRKFMTHKDNGMTLSESAEGVVMWSKGSDQEETSVTLTNTDTYDVIKRYKTDMDEMKQVIEQQTEVIQQLADKMDKQQEYIEGLMEARDQLLLESMQKSLEDSKAKDEEKRGFFKRLFGG